MGLGTIGMAAMGGDAREVLTTISDLETIGIDAAWLTTGGAGQDALTLFAGAAAQTEHILLGTSIMPTWPRHPVVAVQQVQVLTQLAPRRFRLGIGPSHRMPMTRMFGADFESPLTHLREYLHITRQLMKEGSVQFSGRYFKVDAQIPEPIPDVPVMASALRPAAFELCGELADGAISWVCPARYLSEVGLPALKRGAEAAGRAVPPLVAHMPVCVHDDPSEARAEFREQFGRYAASPFYQRMFESAGYPEALEGRWSDAMVESVLVTGDEESVAGGFQEMFERGVSEVLVSISTAGTDPARSRRRTMDLVAALATAS